MFRGLFELISTQLPLSNYCFRDEKQTFADAGSARARAELINAMRCMGKGGVEWMACSSIYVLVAKFLNVGVCRIVHSESEFLSQTQFILFRLVMSSLVRTLCRRMSFWCSVK